MDKCIFCEIASGKIDSAIVWEDERHVSVLDVNPNTKGMTLVMTRKHFDSYAFDMPDEDFSSMMQAAKKTARILESGLGVQRVAMVMEGMGINHVHIKLYPIFGVDEKFKEMWAKEKIFFERYEGYISTQLGPKSDIAELKKLAEEIKNSSKH